MVAPRYWRYARFFSFLCRKISEIPFEFIAMEANTSLVTVSFFFQSLTSNIFIFIFWLHLYRHSTHCRAKNLSGHRHVLVTALRLEYVIWGVALFPLRLLTAFLGLVLYSDESWTKGFMFFVLCFSFLFFFFVFFFFFFGSSVVE